VEIGKMEKPKVHVSYIKGNTHGNADLEVFADAAEKLDEFKVIVPAPKM
jgi:hypothetical protein